MNRNSIIITVISVIAAFAFLYGVYIATNKPPAPPKVYKETSIARSDDHMKWSSAKKHLLVEYADLQCPACKNYHDIVKKDIESSGSKGSVITKNVTFVFRHFPLTVVHRHAQQAAYAAEAAAIQGKFFEMVDKLFEKQDEWSKLDNVSEYFTKVAKDLKLDEKKFKEDMSSQKVKDKVQKDITSGQAVDVRATPTYFLDGKKVEDVSSFEQFIDLLKKTPEKKTS